MDAIFNFLNGVVNLITVIVTRYSPEKEIDKIVRIYDAMSEIVSTTDAQRVTIIKAHNGGGEIRVDRHLYITALYEQYRAPMVSIKNDFQKLEVDESYIRMLLRLVGNTQIALERSEAVLNDGLVAELLDRYNVAHSRLFFIAKTKKEFFFLGVSTSAEEHRLDTDSQQASLRIALSKIKNAFRR